MFLTFVHHEHIQHLSTAQFLAVTESQSRPQSVQKKVLAVMVPVCCCCYLTTRSHWMLITMFLMSVFPDQLFSSRMLILLDLAPTQDWVIHYNMAPGTYLSCVEVASLETLASSGYT